MASAKRVKSKTVSAGPKLSPGVALQQARAAMLDSLELPDGPQEAETDIGAFSILIYGPPGIGKTEAFATFPAAIFAATEPGTIGLKHIDVFNSENGGVTDWHVMLRLVNRLEAHPARYRSVIIDTGEEAYTQCMIYVCERDKIHDPSEGEGGSGWLAVRREFTQMIQRIKRSGRAVHFTSHSKQMEVKQLSGKKYMKVIPTLSGQARSIIEPLVAFIFYMDFMRSTEEADVSRVIFTQGTDYVTAKSHKVDGRDILPAMIPAIYGGLYAMLQAAVEGADVGLDPTTLLATKRTMEAVNLHMSEGRKSAARRVTRARGSVARVKGGS